jgi:predicted site-specific integrase-resolvase
MVIDGVTYFSVIAAAKAAGVSRQTVWRWHQDGKIPPGHLYRGRYTVFSASELNAIREFANRIEPIRRETVGQLGLFNGNRSQE